MKANPILLILLVLLVSNQAFTQNDYHGKDFWLCFPQNARPENASHLLLRVYIVGSPNTEGTIEELRLAKKIPFSIGPSGYTTWDADTLNQLMGDGISYKSIHITSNADISIVALSHRKASTDSYAAIPTDKLGKEYIVAGYSPLSGNESGFTTQFEAIAIEDNTKITVTSPNGKIIKEEVLNQGRILNVRSQDFPELQRDLSGSFVRADKPVAFFTGHQCAQVPSEVNFCDQLIEMTPPMNSLGTLFPIGALARKEKYTIRVFARDNNTIVKINDSIVKTLGSGQYYENNIMRSNALIETSKPTLVMQYGQSSGVDSTQIADPFMMNVAPAERFVKNTDFFILNFEASDRAFPETHGIISIRNKDSSLTDVPGGGWQHYVNIISIKEGINKIYDGDTKINPQYFIQISNTSYYSAQIVMQSGVHRLHSDIPIGVYSYGYGSIEYNYDSYGHLCNERIVTPTGGY
jgi:hypothetical protein